MDIKVRRWSGELASLPVVQSTKISQLQAKCATLLGLPGMSLGFVHESRLLDESESAINLLGQTLDVVQRPLTVDGLDLGGIAVVSEHICTMRKGLEISSEIVRDLQPEERLEVLDLAIAQCGLHRAKVTTGKLTGWVTIQTRDGQHKLLVPFDPESFKAGSRCRVLSATSVFGQESAPCTPIAELAQGTRLTVLGQGVHDCRRLRIAASNGCNGWIAARISPSAPLIWKEGFTASLFGDGDHGISASLEHVAFGHPGLWDHLHTMVLWVCCRALDALGPDTQDRWLAWSSHISCRHYNRLFGIAPPGCRL